MKGAPHWPTLPWVIAVIVVIFVLYHFVFHRGSGGNMMGGYAGYGG